MGEALKGWTTKVSVGRTAGEVQEMLGMAGAGEIMIRYEHKRPVGVSFTLDMPGGKSAFAMPINVDGVAAVLRRQVNHSVVRPRSGLTRELLLSAEHAERVAWRIARDWLDAQLALVEAGMVTLQTTMLPYLLITPTETLAQRFASSGLRELT
ncbi:MAG: hypothetical protein H7Y15_00845 [Pseudonocardia sp.]|nr:hypothetical protein [Pseudonocardia sp.]